MALFPGEEMVEVTHPDGRTFTLPRSLAPASMIAPQQQQIGNAPVPFTAEVAGGPDAAPGVVDVIPSVTGGQMPQQTPEAVYDAPAPAQNIGPDFSLGTVDVEQIEKRQAKQAKQRAKDEKAYAKWAASDEGKLAVAQQKQEDAADKEIAATRKAAALAAGEQAVLADAMAQADVDIDKVVAGRAKAMTERLKEEDAKRAEGVTLRTKMANFKVDRTHDSPTMAAIGMMLSALGTAINNTTYKRNDVNPALKIYDDAIDRKVAWQMADLDKMGKIYGMTMEELGELKDKSKSTLELWNIMGAAEHEKALRTVKNITARSASAQTKANAEIAVAHIEQRIGEKSEESLRRGLDFNQRAKQHAETQKTARYGIAVQDRHNKANEQIQREKIAADKIAAYAGDKARGDEARFKARTEAEKEVRNYGVKGANNKILMTPEGRAAEAEAEKLEAAAAAIESNPDQMARSVFSDKAALMKQRAAELRGDAATFGAVLLRNDPVATKVPSLIAARQSMLDVIDDIKMIEAGRGLLGKSVDQQALDTLYGLLAVKGKAAWDLGAWDKGTAVLSKGIYGSNPSEWDQKTLRGFVSDVLGDDPEGYKARLDVVARDLEGTSRSEVQQHSNWDGKGELFTRKKIPDMNNPIDKASAQFSQARGVAKSADGAGDTPVGAFARETFPDKQSSKYTGLTEDQAAPFDTLLTAHKSGNKAASGQLIAKVIDAAEKNPELAISMLHNLEEHDHGLYRVARAGLPKDGAADKQMTFEANSKIARAPRPTQEIAAMVIATLGKDGEVGADDDYAELGRRAGREGTSFEEPGDKGAKKALSDIANANYKKKFDASLPRGSVFKGGR